MYSRVSGIPLDRQLDHCNSTAKVRDTLLPYRSRPAQSLRVVGGWAILALAGVLVSGLASVAHQATEGIRIGTEGVLLLVSEPFERLSHIDSVRDSSIAVNLEGETVGYVSAVVHLKDTVKAILGRSPQSGLAAAALDPLAREIYVLPPSDSSSYLAFIRSASLVSKHADDRSPFYIELSRAAAGRTDLLVGYVFIVTPDVYVPLYGIIPSRSTRP